jgi:hypothetical protein
MIQEAIHHLRRLADHFPDRGPLPGAREKIREFLDERGVGVEDGIAEHRPAETLIADFLRIRLGLAEAIKHIDQEDRIIVQVRQQFARATVVAIPLPEWAWPTTVTALNEVVLTAAKKGLWQSPGNKTPDQTLYASILRDEFEYVETDADEGQDQVGSMIETFVRLKAPQAVIDWHINVRDSAIHVLVSDDPSDELAYVTFIAMDGGDVFIGYSSQQPA